ncbi:MAG: glycosyl hydrolase family 5 [Chitinophaga sp.]|jgi:endoglucanase|nr:glycosyl hydrolase family 5 [Chitinophaga sp.]
MKSLCKILIVIICTFNYLYAQKFISVKGKEIIGVDGKPFLMRGTNLGNWLLPEGYMFKFSEANSPRLINEVISELIGPAAAKKFWKEHLSNYVTRKDIQYLHFLGMNSIRIPFHYKLFTNEEYLGESNSLRGFTLMDSVIKWCTAENIFVILDMHAAPGGQTGDNIDDSYGYPFIYENKDYQEQICSIWMSIAEHYKNNATVLGYDLFNEPIPHFMDTAKLNPLLEPLLKKIKAAIRTKDKNHIIFLEGAQWASNFNAFGKPFDNNLVYQFHKYWTAATVDVIQSYIDFRNKYNVPIYCGETGENDDVWIETFRKVLEKNNIGWHYWPYKKMDDSRGIVQFDRPKNYQLIIDFANSNRNNFEQIRKFKPSDINIVKQALFDYTLNSKFEFIKPNTSYIKALGLKTN